MGVTAFFSAKCDVAKVAEVSLKFTGFFGVKFRGVGDFCVRKNDKAL